MLVHMVSETEYFAKGQGVHTAFIDNLELLRNQKDIELVVNNEGYGDVFHSHTYGPFYFWKGRNYKGKRIHTVHVIPDSLKGSIPFWKFLMPIAKLYFKMVYSYADVCIAISPMVEESIKALGVKTTIKRISNSIPIDRWKRSEIKRNKGRELLNLEENEFVILGVGQLQERKGIDDFIELAAKIPNAKFVWAGGRPFGKFTEGIKRIDEKIKNATSNIQFTGLVDLMQMPHIYAAADLFLFTSFQENCPLAPLEAAASGIPVIYRDLKEYELLYKNPYIKAKDINGFEKMIFDFMHNPNYYVDGVKISEKLVTQFDKDKIRVELVKLYNELIVNNENAKFNLGSPSLEIQM
jgi:1,2-diacylglycerol-3-alpha-glucose alpha-1,2-galactosyltransferase